MRKEPESSVRERQISAAVLAGGQSRRMGQDKALLDFDGRPLVSRVADRLIACSDDVFVVTKDTGRLQELGVRVVSDASEVDTPLAGILAALRAAQHELVFVCACDMPFVSPDLVRFLADRAVRTDAVVPVHDGRAELTHAVWAVHAADKLAHALDSGERAVHRALESLDVEWVGEDSWRAVDPDGRSLVNVNTPAELEQARRRG